MRHGVRAEYLTELLRFLPDVAPSALLADDFTPADLSDPERLIDGDGFCRVVERAVELTGDPSFGTRFGWQLGTTKHGFLGYLARSCNTLREKFAYDAEFLPTRVSALTCSLHEAGDSARLEFRTAVALQGWPVLVNLIHGTMARAWQEILPEEVTRDLGDRIVVETHEMSMSITMPRALLDVPLRLGDERLKELSAQQCARTLSEHPKQTTIAEATSKLLSESLDASTTLETVARRLAVSPRTLRRKLAAEGTSFQKLLDEAREAKARHLLRATDKSVEEIALDLAFQGASSFCQAFKRWTGQSPGQFRVSK